MKKVIVIAFVLWFILLPSKIVAQEYGGGNYGSGDYNVGEVIATPTPSPTPTPSTSSTNTDNNTSTPTANASGPSTPGCDSQIGIGSPDIFEIQTSNTSATIYFSPPQNPYSSFYIAYSTKNTYWEYGIEFNQSYSSGAIGYKINALNPNTLYYFQSRAGNGCASGTWGNVLSAKTTNSVTTHKTSYKNFQIAIKQTAKKILARLSPAKDNSETIPVIAQQTNTPIPLSTPTPRVITPSPLPLEPVVSNVSQVETPKRFCILWWCFQFNR